MDNVPIWDSDSLRTPKSNPFRETPPRSPYSPPRPSLPPRSPEETARTLQRDADNLDRAKQAQRRQEWITIAAGSSTAFESARALAEFVDEVMACADKRFPDG